MKKERQTSRQGPIQLSANKKSHSINLKTKQEPLFAPYKIDWKNPLNDNLLFSANQSVPIKQPLKNIQNSASNTPFGTNPTSNTNSKLFYKNMKNELLNIKQDVEKLISKEKKASIASIDQMITANNDQSVIDYQNSNGCIKTINIKNKCQQKATKPYNVCQNIEKALDSKISDNGSGMNKFTFSESRNEHPVMHNFIEDSMKNNSNIEAKYRTEKDNNYIRAKSKSIAQSFSKGFALDLLNARQEVRENNKVSIASSMKFLEHDDSQNQQEHFTERSEHVKHKMEVEIKLPSFEKAKSGNVNEQKNKLIEKLQSQLNDLEKELSLRDELMSRKEQSKFQLTEEVEKIKRELESQKRSNQQKSTKYEEQMNNLRNSNQESDNRAIFYEEELQKAIYVIRQKEQQTFSLIEASNQQANTIQELNLSCQKFAGQWKEMKHSADEAKGIKDKMKLKENQLYIYQEQLKEAKSKIKELKESMNGFAPSRLTENSTKPIEEQQEALEQASKLAWELKECRKSNDNFKAQNQRIKKQLHSINITNSENQSKISNLLKQNSQLTTKILNFEKNSQNAIQDLINNSNFQGIGNEISKKLSQMVDENYQLKNKISRLESSIEELTLKNNSIMEQLEIYQEKTDSFKDCTRRLKIQDWDNLTEEKDNLKQELEIVKNRLEQTKEFYEVETMRKENQIHELKQRIEQIMDAEGKNEEIFHTNVRSVKHIKNLQILLNEFKDMIEYNLQMKEELDKMKR